MLEKKNNNESPDWVNHVKREESEWKILISPDDFTNLFNTMITVISPNPHRLLINEGMIVDHLRPCGTYTGRAGMWEPRSFLYFTAQAVLKISLKSSLRYLDFLICNLEPLMEEFLWCGGWAYSALGAFALSCPLCLHFVLKLSSLVLFFCLCLYLLLVAGVWVWDLLYGGPHNVETDIEVLGLVGDVECVCILYLFFFFGLTNLHASCWFLS